VTAETSNALASALLQSGARLNGMHLTFACPSPKHNGHVPATWNRQLHTWICSVCGEQPLGVLIEHLRVKPMTNGHQHNAQSTGRSASTQSTSTPPPDDSMDKTDRLTNTKADPVEPINILQDEANSQEQMTTGDTSPDGFSWPTLNQAAYHGLVGEYVNAVAPHSEADPVGILLQLLVACGSLIGSGPHACVEHKPHPPRLNLLLVGKTAKGRKGTAWHAAKHLLAQVDPEWAKNRVKSGLSSGEGLIYNVRDPKDSDRGKADKRLLIVEEEFASPLKKMRQEGNILSPVMRDAWEHGNLSPLTKHDQIAATNAHVSIIGHSTIEELLRKLTTTDRVNGFANRFLIALVRRIRFLPEGKGAPVQLLDKYISRFSPILRHADSVGRIARDVEATKYWASIYPQLEEEILGLTGAILGRGAAQTLRLSLVYAFLDEKEMNRGSGHAIRVEHVKAAEAVWNYCKASVHYIFGLGEPDASRLLWELQDSEKTDTELYEILGNRKGASERKDRAMAMLASMDLAHSDKGSTGGRPVTRWHYGNAERCGLCGKSSDGHQP
jgi:hypothetical protein